jgi:hypothetical protein
MKKHALGMDTVTNAPIKPAFPRHRWRRILLSILCVLLVGWGIGNLTSSLTAYTSRQPGPGGFGRGVLHGVLMPFSLLNLVVGQDVSIYQTENTGRTYKLGYTLGVNSCGLIFFGVFFWRLSRLRKLLKQKG